MALKYLKTNSPFPLLSQLEDQRCEILKSYESLKDQETSLEMSVTSVLQRKKMQFLDADVFIQFFVATIAPGSATISGKDAQQ